MPRIKFRPERVGKRGRKTVLVKAHRRTPPKRIGRKGC